jgi:hypothetical protein
MWWELASDPRRHSWRRSLPRGATLRAKRCTSSSPLPPHSWACIPARMARCSLAQTLTEPTAVPRPQLASPAGCSPGPPPIQAPTLAAGREGTRKGKTKWEGGAGQLDIAQFGFLHKRVVQGCAWVCNEPDKEKTIPRRIQLSVWDLMVHRKVTERKTKPVIWGLANLYSFSVDLLNKYIVLV